MTPKAFLSPPFLPQSYQKKLLKALRLAVNVISKLSSTSEVREDTVRRQSKSKGYTGQQGEREGMRDRERGRVGTWRGADNKVLKVKDLC